MTIYSAAHMKIGTGVVVWCEGWHQLKDGMDRISNGREKMTHIAGFSDHSTHYTHNTIQTDSNPVAGTSVAGRENLGNN